MYEPGQLSIYKEHGGFMIKKKVKKVVKKKGVVGKEYTQILAAIKKQVQEAQTKAVLAVNKELIKLYWHIGQTIAQKQKESGWGSGVIEQLANDLQKAFPGLGGFSRANVFYMRSFYLAYEKVQKPSGQLDGLPFFNIPWWHNVILITKLKQENERLWYAQKAIENGWSGSV